MTRPAEHRLRKHADYQLVYRQAGRKRWARQVAYFSAVRLPGSVLATRADTTGPRVGMTVPKVLGKAVSRNRIKRRLREVVRVSLPLLGQLPVDVILHPKRDVLECGFPELREEVARIFRSVRSRASKSVVTPLPSHAASPVRHIG